MCRASVFGLVHCLCMLDRVGRRRIAAVFCHSTTAPLAAEGHLLGCRASPPIQPGPNKHACTPTARPPSCTPDPGAVSLGTIPSRNPAVFSAPMSPAHVAARVMLPPMSCHRSWRVAARVAHRSCCVAARVVGLLGVMCMLEEKKNVTSQEPIAQAFYLKAEPDNCWGY